MRSCRNYLFNTVSPEELVRFIVDEMSLLLFHIATQQCGPLHSAGKGYIHLLR